MTDKKYIYRPLASYQKLKQAEEAIRKSKTLDDLRAAIAEHGPRVGYKAFSYIFMEKMTPEAMKPKEAAQVARQLEQLGKNDLASEIYTRILEWHTEEALRLPEAAGEPASTTATQDSLPQWIDSIDVHLD